MSFSLRWANVDEGPAVYRPLSAIVWGLLLLALLLAGAVQAAETRPAPSPGLQVPDCSLFNPNHTLHWLHEYQEPVLVLNFWAFWCDTWKAELPQLRELAGQQQDLHFRLLAISVDGQWSDVRRQYLKGQMLDFPVLLDGDRILARTLGLRRVPTVMVLDRQRQVTWVHEAYPGNPSVLQAIRRALSGYSPGQATRWPGSPCRGNLIDPPRTNCQKPNSCFPFAYRISRFCSSVISAPVTVPSV